MSTKITLSYGENFHFYEECFDEYSKYLEIDLKEDSFFKVTKDKIILKIDYYIWDSISKCTSKKLEWVNKSDEDILNKVESLVDSRIKESKINKIAALSGILIFGDVESSREEQIKNGIKYFKNKRNEERRLNKLINKNNQKNEV